MRFVFWENIVSPHRSAFLRALVERGHECTLVVDRIASPERLAMGWAIPDVKKVRVVEAPDENVMRTVMDDSSMGTIHVLGGCHFCRTEMYARRRCMAEGRRFGMIAEGGIDLTWRRFLRRFKVWYYARAYRNLCDFVLAMGDIGVNWYRWAGYREERIFPNSYTVEYKHNMGNTRNVEGLQDGSAVDAGESEVGQERSEIGIVYAGSFNYRKATDLLMEAVVRVGTCLPQVWRMTMIGDGEQRSRLEQEVHRVGLAQRVDFPGFLPSQEVHRRIEHSDLVVVPSRYDGWCAVVNEALQSGTPVVCSDRVGAGCLVDGRPELGEVYPCNDTERLAEILRRRIAAGKVTTEQRRRIRDWSVRIQGPAVAEYFEKVMLHVYEGGPRPAPTWETEPAGQ